MTPLFFLLVCGTFTDSAPACAPPVRVESMEVCDILARQYRDMSYRIRTRCIRINRVTRR